MTKPPSIAEIAPSVPIKKPATIDIPQVANICHRNTVRNGLPAISPKHRGSPQANSLIVLSFVASRQTVLQRNMGSLPLQLGQNGIQLNQAGVLDRQRSAPFIPGFDLHFGAKFLRQIFFQP